MEERNGRKIYTAKEVKTVVTELNIRHGWSLAVEGGGPLRIVTIDRQGWREAKSPWLTRSQALTWLAAFEAGANYGIWTADEAARLARELDSMREAAREQGKAWPCIHGEPCVCSRP